MSRRPPWRISGTHRSVTVSAACAAGSRCVGGGGYLRRAADPAAVPTNGLVLGGTTASTGTAGRSARTGRNGRSRLVVVDRQLHRGQRGRQRGIDVRAVHDHRGTEPHGRRGGQHNRRERDAGGSSRPRSRPRRVRRAGSRLIGGGATTRTPDQVNDGVTVGNEGNLEPSGQLSFRPDRGPGGGRVDERDVMVGIRIGKRAGRAGRRDRLRPVLQRSRHPCRPGRADRRRRPGQPAAGDGHDRVSDLRRGGRGCSAAAIA